MNEKAVRWLEPFRNLNHEGAILEKLMEGRLELFGANIFDDVSRLVCKQYRDIEERDQYVLLQTMSEYHSLIALGEKPTLVLAMRFLMLEPRTPAGTSPITEFCRLYYALLCCEHSDNYNVREVLAVELLRRATSVVSSLDIPDNHLARAQLYEVESRMLLRKGKKREAMRVWTEGSRRFWCHYMSLEDSCDNEDVLLASARQAASMRLNFEQSFPGEAIGHCGISKHEMLHLEEKFGEKLSNVASAT